LKHRQVLSLDFAPLTPAVQSDQGKAFGEKDPIKQIYKKNKVCPSPSPPPAPLASSPPSALTGAQEIEKLNTECLELESQCESLKREVQEAWEAYKGSQEKAALREAELLDEIAQIGPPQSPLCLRLDLSPDPSPHLTPFLLRRKSQNS
jgi:outer membrane murein-binding lipoprotein Lpp